MRGQVRSARSTDPTCRSAGSLKVMSMPVIALPTVMEGKRAFTPQKEA